MSNKRKFKEFQPEPTVVSVGYVEIDKHARGRMQSQTKLVKANLKILYHVVKKHLIIRGDSALGWWYKQTLYLYYVDECFPNISCNSLKTGYCRRYKNVETKNILTCIMEMYKHKFKIVNTKLWYIFCAWIIQFRYLHILRWLSVFHITVVLHKSGEKGPKALIYYLFTYLQDLSSIWYPNS